MSDKLNMIFHLREEFMQAIREKYPDIPSQQPVVPEVTRDRSEDIAYTDPRFKEAQDVPPFFRAS